MKKKRFYGISLLSVVIIFLVLLFHVAVPSVLAHFGHNAFGTTTEEQYEELQRRESKKKELEQKIYEAQVQERTLANQITYLENQINLTLLQQEETIQGIDELQLQLEEVSIGIVGLGEKLENLGDSIDDLHTVLSKRVRSSYQMDTATPSELLFEAKDLRHSVLQLAYLKSLQQEDNKLLSRMSKTKETYQKQKQQLETLKSEKENLKAQLEIQRQVLEEQKNNLSNQQSTKSWLLDVTRNEEQQYQTLLAQVEEEIRAIKVALTSAGTKIGDVQPGDIIAHVGNTGCSTGAHLHFGYYANGVATDPMGQFNSGAFRWPLGDPVITQVFNDARTRSWYQANFGMAGHNGVDFVDGYLGAGAPILAVKEGIAYAVSDSKPCYLTGTVGKGIRIDHPDGTKTIYWHVQ